MTSAGTSSRLTQRASALAEICSATSCANALNSSVPATKSVSQPISTSTPMRPPCT